MRERERDSGFTLIELLVVMIIAAVLMALGASGWTSFQRSSEHRGTANEIVSVLRNAQQKAYAEASTFCVQFNADGTYQTYQFECGASGVAVGGLQRVRSARVSLDAVKFKHADGSEKNTVLFLPRGTATKGSLKVARTGSDSKYSIKVEGLTGRVTLG